MVASICLGLVFFEIGARILEEKTYDISSCQSLDEDFHHVMIPNSSCRFKTEEWDIDYKINNLGLRGPDVKLKKEPGVLRILILGDSFMQGYGVDFAKSFSFLLEEKLNSVEVFGKVEIVNTGVFAYSPLVQYLYLVKKGLAFDPDLVLLAFTPTDFWEDRQRLAELRLSYPGLSDEQIIGFIEAGEAKFKFDLINRRPTNRKAIQLPGILGRVKFWVSQNLVSYRVLADFVKKKSAPQAGESGAWGNIDLDILAIDRGAATSDSDWEALWVLPLGHIKMMRDLLDSWGIPLVVMSIPDPVQVSDLEWPGRNALGMPAHYVDYRTPFGEELAKRLANIKNIPSINLLPEFKASSDGPFYFASDAHWNDSGHNLAADVVFKFLTTERKNLRVKVAP